MVFNTTTMHFKLVLLAICAIALVACEARGRGYNRPEGQDDAAARDETRRYDNQERSDSEIQQLSYKPQDTYDQNTGKGRRIGNDQRSRDSRIQQQSGSQEAMNGIYREDNW